MTILSGRKVCKLIYDISKFNALDDSFSILSTSGRQIARRNSKKRGSEIEMKTAAHGYLLGEAEGRQFWLGDICRISHVQLWKGDVL